MRKVFKLVYFFKIMDKTLLLAGKVGNQESYQLMINRDYISATYDGSAERIPFYKKVSDTFVERILAEHFPLEVWVFNGLRINPKTGSHEKLPKLEDAFSKPICKNCL
jgi:hypothetical protein